MLPYGGPGLRGDCISSSIRRNCCEARTQSQAAAQALAAAMSNIYHHSQLPVDKIAIANSCKSIETTLKRHFNGFAYNARQLAEANESRVIHFLYRMLDAYEAKDYKLIDTLSQKQIVDGNTIVINEDYRIPAHFAHQIIFYLFLAYAQSPAHLLQFRATYQEYSRCVIDLAPDSWLQQRIQLRLKRIMREWWN